MCMYVFVVVMPQGGCMLLVMPVKLAPHVPVTQGHIHLLMGVPHWHGWVLVTAERWLLFKWNDVLIGLCRRVENIKTIANAKQCCFRIEYKLTWRIQLTKISRPILIGLQLFSCSTVNLIWFLWYIADLYIYPIINLLSINQLNSSHLSWKIVIEMLRRSLSVTRSSFEI